MVLCSPVYASVLTRDLQFSSCGLLLHAVFVVQDLFMTLLFAGTQHAMSPRMHGSAYFV